MKHLDIPISFEQALSLLGKLPAEGILYVKNDVYLVANDTDVYPCITSSRDLSDDEFNSMLKSIENDGFTKLLDNDQIIDIKDNLEEQKKNYSQIELLYAINYYWDRDAFVCL